MGKKNKKFKKRGSPNIQKPIQNSPADISESSQKTNLIPKKTEETEEKLEISIEKEYAYVKKDVVRILLTMLLIVIFLVVLYFVGQKTTFLAQIGDWFYKILNIQT